MKPCTLVTHANIFINVYFLPTKSQYKKPQIDYERSAPSASHICRITGRTDRQRSEQRRFRELLRTLLLERDHDKNDVNTMGSDGVDVGIKEEEKRKPRILCLHGFRTSGEILKTQLKKWPESVLEKVEMFFPDGPFPSTGKSDVEGIFDPPYYEWFQFNKEFTTYENFDKCLEYIEECMIKHGPIDGLLGFSQGAILSAALPGLQAKGLALTKVPKIKFLMIISGAKLRNEELAEMAYSSPIQCPSIHTLGENDFLKPHGIELLKSVIDPVVVHHPKGHTIPRLDDKGLEAMMNFLQRIQKIVSCNEEEVVTK